jgi:hypothetical protein
VRLAGDAEHLTTRGADLRHHAGSFVASQLEATGRSPEPTIEQEHDELVFRELTFEPLPPYAFRRIEERRDTTTGGLDEAEPIPITGGLNTDLLACADLAITKDEP